MQEPAGMSVLIKKLDASRIWKRVYKGEDGAIWVRASEMGHILTQ